MATEWQFHDRAVVASLKPTRPRPDLPEAPEFHDRAVVASLKRGGFLEEFGIEPQFHDRAVVASLKLNLCNKIRGKLW